ncbi:MAG: hypothetical protein J5608_01620 [Alphaproteobacteria bacterium]|nr:hypothetical protein [Alphaproteobacteria bacterium]
MKKTLKTLAIATASLITTGAMAGVTNNMENPLFIPQAGEFASKTALGLMYKKTDHTEALKKKNHDGADEFPVWRAFQDFGYGITDRASTYLSLGWTQNDDIGRSGAHRARLGLNYRIIETLENFVWDMYGEAYMGGLSKMTGSYNLKTGFKYDNFSSGRWGAVVGTKVGKRWSNFTATIYGEYLRIFGNHNNEIDTSALSAYGFPDEISVDLKATTELLAGINGFYQINDRWSFGGGFKFIEHTDNGVKSIHTDVNSPLAGKLVEQTKNMKDGWDEYYLTATIANQMTDSVQLALYAEYVFDDSHSQSQNGTDIKAELGVRMNVRF